MTTAARPALIALCLAAAPACGQEQIAVPSGRAVTFEEAVNSAPGPSGLTIRYRFILPDLTRPEPGALPDETIFEDMAWLCASFVLPRLTVSGPLPQQIVISLADRPVPFGEADPEAVQVFEAYRLQDGLCVWEAF